MLNVYGDESTDDKAQRVFAVAGIIGREAQWEALEVKWLERTMGIPFHAKDCESDRRNYANYTHQENLNLYRDLTTLLAGSGVLGYAFVVDLASQRKVFPDPIDFTYQKCLVEVVDRLTQIAAHNNEEVKFSFDMRRQSDYNSGLLYNMMFEDPDLAKWLHAEISFVSHITQRRIQAADLFAREARKAAEILFSRSDQPVRKSWIALRDTGRFNVVAISLEYFEDVKKGLPELYQKLGLSPDGYRRWITETNRQDNLSNRLLYMQKAMRRPVHSS
jgi:hypothetical protein